MAQTTVNWRRVWGIMRVHDWNWADLSRKMWVSQSHLSDVRHRKKDVTLAFAELLCHVLQVSYDNVLIHPTVDRSPSAREVLAMNTLDDGRPWPTGVPAEKEDYLSRLQRYRKEQNLANKLAIFPGRKNGE